MLPNLLIATFAKVVAIMGGVTAAAYLLAGGAI
jgi:cytochrome c oxidase subunit I+III